MRGWDRSAKSRAYFLGMNCYPAMLMNTRGLREQEREFPWPAPKIKPLKSKQLPSLHSARGGAKEKMLKMMVDPAISMKTND